MKTQYDLSKEVFSKSQYQNTIDTNFNQLITPQNEIAGDVLPTVNQFFDYYNQLFFDIPKFGETNSHAYLIKTSQEYIGQSLVNEEIQALTAEITNLRQQLLDVTQQAIQSQTTNTLA
jgi:hypothetical protein